MKLTKINNLKYKVNNEGIIYIENSKLFFDISTFVLIEVFDNFLKKIKDYIKEDYITYKGNNVFLKNKYYTDKKNTTYIYLRKYTAMVKSEYLYDKDYTEIFKERGNWEIKENNYVDFFYLQGPTFLFNKKYWSVKSKIINRIDKQYHEYLRKDKLSNLINNKFLNLQYNFTLSKKFNPKSAQDFIEKRKVVIMKPADGYSGIGIKIIDNYEDFHKRIKELKKLKNKDNWSIKGTKKTDFISNLYWSLETYIQNPYLYENKKFHFRSYYIYTTENEGFIYNKHRIALAEEDFKLNDFNNTKIHDTHFSVKENVKILFLDDILTEEEYLNIQDQIVMIFKELTENFKAKPYPEAEIAFQIFACDLMITKDLNVKLLELNSNPGFNKDLPQSKEILESVMTNIVDKFFPSKNNIEKKNYFIKVTNSLPRTARGLSKNSFIGDIAEAWNKEGYGPKAKKDRTGGYYLSCKGKDREIDDFHIHIVGPEGKYHKNSWSRKVRERRRWEALDFRLTAKEQAYHIYVKSEFRKNKDCLDYYLSRH